MVKFTRYFITFPQLPPRPRNLSFWNHLSFCYSLGWGLSRPSSQPSSWDFPLSSPLFISFLDPIISFLMYFFTLVENIIQSLPEKGLKKGDSFEQLYV